eukprot:4302884-Amphidinium_carterae.3
MISSAFLYADLPEEQQVVCYLPEGTPGSRDDSGIQIPYLVVKSLYALGEIGCTRSKLDPGVFYKGTPDGSQVSDRVRPLGRWLLKAARGFALCNDGKLGIAEGTSGTWEGQ